MIESLLLCQLGLGPYSSHSDHVQGGAELVMTLALLPRPDIATVRRRAVCRLVENLQADSF